jgi:protein ImuB
MSKGMDATPGADVRGAPTRALVALFPDWPVMVSGHCPEQQVAAVYANRVVATSPGARAAGVRRGMRRRESQAVCPALVVVQRDEALEARTWEPVVAAVEAFAPGAEVTFPGQLAIGTRGPSRYFGGDDALAAKVLDVIEEVVGAGPVGRAWAGRCGAGAGDSLFCASVAARLAAGAGSAVASPSGPAPLGRSLIVPAGSAQEFLSPQPLSVLLWPGTGAYLGEDPAGLVDLLGRLGIKTLAALASLPAPAVLARFGPAGHAAHALARGLAGRPLDIRVPGPDWQVSAEIDPPADQVQAAVFVGRALAEQLHERLSASGLVCTRLAVEAQTEHGTALRRSWRHDGALSAAAIGERVRWQLEGWALGDQAAAAQGGRVSALRLVPEEVRPDRGRQLGFWGGDAEAAERAARAMARAQSLLGPEAVFTAVLQGGRDYLSQVCLVPWGEPPQPQVPPAPPWPGRAPGLAPAVVYRAARPAEVLDADGSVVTVAARSGLSAVPAWVVVGEDGRRHAVQAWAGPWPLEERWWDSGGRRRARLQVGTIDGHCYLLVREKRRWWVEACYD